MLNQIILYFAAFFPVVWGITHLFPTRSVVKGFGEISQDNRNIITMEWIIEGVTLIFIGLIMAVVTWIDISSTLSHTIYWICFIQLNVLSIISLFTGFRVNFLPFKLCPFIFSGSSFLILLGILL